MSRRPKESTVPFAGFLDDVEFPNGVHRGRRVVDVAASDPIFADSWYLQARARWPRPGWPAEVVRAVKLFAALREPGVGGAG